MWLKCISPLFKNLFYYIKVGIKGIQITRTCFPDENPKDSGGFRGGSRGSPETPLHPIISFSWGISRDFVKLGKQTPLFFV